MCAFSVGSNMKSYSISQRKKSRGNMTWYGRTFDDGVLVEEVSLKTVRKSDAVAWLDAMNASRFLPENLLAVPRRKSDKDVHDAVSAFMLSVQAEKGLNSATYRAYRSRLKQFEEWCNVEHIATLRAFTRERALSFASEVAGTDSPKTAHERIRLMRQFFSWCADTFGMDGYDPMKSVKAPKVAKRSKAFWTPEEIDRILDNAPTPEFRLFWSLMAYAGLRHAEACAFGPSCMVDGRLRIVGKGNKEAFVPVGRRLEEEMKNVALSEGMFAAVRYRKPERCMRTLKEAVERAGMDASDATNHKFRHSFASNLLRGGVNIRALKDLLRHSDVRISLDTYSHLLQEDLKESVDVL